MQMSMMFEDSVLVAVKAVDFAVASEAKVACYWVNALGPSSSPALQDVFLRRICGEAELEMAVTQLQQWSQYADQNQFLYKMVLQRMVTPAGRETSCILFSVICKPAIHSLYYRLTACEIPSKCLSNLQLSHLQWCTQSVCAIHVHMLW